MDYLFGGLALAMTVLQIVKSKIFQLKFIFLFLFFVFLQDFFPLLFFYFVVNLFLKLMTICCMVDYIDIHLIVFLHYLSSLSIQSILSIRISQDKNQTAYYARQIYSRLIILSYQWQANTSLVSNIRMVYFIEAFNLWRIHWISIWENQFEQYSALIKQRILLRLNRNVNDLKSLFLWKCQLYKLNWLQLIRSKIFLQSKRCHSFFRF